MFQEPMLGIAIGKSRKDTALQNKKVRWQIFYNWCSSPLRTPETMAEYLAMTKEQQGKIKDRGGFVAGELSDGHRKADHVLCRWMVVFDLDDATPEFVANIQAIVPCQGLFYSTHKHRPERPRIRLIIPVARPMTLDEFVAVSRLLAYELGILEMVDVCSFQPHQLMYWPTVSRDGEFICGQIDKAWLNPDEVLARYPGWRDFSTLPHISGERLIKRLNQGKAMDPLQKSGVHGAFNRVFDIHGAIERFLPEIYESTSKEDRYTYRLGECSAGLVVYDHGNYAYSHHNHDPICGRLCDAYDLVRSHLFKELSDRKSKEAMFKLISELPEMKLEFSRMHEARMAKAREFDAGAKAMPAEASAQKASVQKSVPKASVTKAEADTSAMAEPAEQDWQLLLTYNKEGNLINNRRNLAHILEHDPLLQDIVYNELSGFVEVKGQVPWYHPGTCWRDQDNAQLLMYLEEHYGSFSTRVYDVAFAKVVDDRRYHPIKEYLASLPAWDGVPRVDRLLVDYLGAEDNAYIHAVTRKTLCGALMRVLYPGCKFDYMLVLNGPQGVGKSTLIRMLGGDWFSDSLSMADTRDKTAAEKLQGYWILEIGELAGMNKMDVETLRSFITRQNDIFRAAYGKQTTEHPRQCIFIGTTNAYDGYLRDNTGNRRFWPVKITGQGVKNSWEMTKKDIQQIWAEAMTYVQAGESLYLNQETDAMARQEQQAAMETDDRVGLVEQFLEIKLTDNWKEKDLLQRQSYFRENQAKDKGTVKRTEVCTYELWCECLGNHKSEMRRLDSNQLMSILTKLGWERASKRNFKLYGNQIVYRKVQGA